MTDIAKFRTDLYDASNQEFRNLDLDEIMATGGTIRRRRRLFGAAAAGTVTGLLLIMMVPFWLAPEGNHSTPVAGGAQAGRPSPAQTGRLGSVITTGVTQRGGELVFWFNDVDLAQLPDVSFGLTAGVRRDDGDPRPAVTTNETEGAQDSPGFHAVQGAMAIDGWEFPTFGYYVGPAVRITATIDGAPATLHQACWDQNSNIVAFWTELGAGEPTDLTAYDAAGAVLPAGNPQVGHG